MPSDAFLIGVATSGYQSEGGFNGVGEPHNNWGWAEQSGRVERTGLAVDFWNRYREDFSLARGIGLNAFRLSMEWSRVQPSFSNDPSPAPDFDEAAIDAYADRLAACREAGMEPVLTLHHFTHPAWLGVDAWLDDNTPGLFENYVRHAVGRINARLTSLHSQPPVRWYVTLNEPNMLVLNTYLNRHFPGGPEAGIPVGLRAYNRMLAAHVRAYHAIHSLHEAQGWESPRVTMNTFCSDVYWSEKMLLDLLHLRVSAVSENDIPDYLKARSLDLSRQFTSLAAHRRSDPAAWAAAGLHRLANFFASRAATVEAFRFFLDEAARIPRTRFLDYLGLDYYDPFLSHALRAPDFSDLEFKSSNISSHVLDVLASKWWDWHFLPKGMTVFCEHYARSYPGLGILIAENGMALRSRRNQQGGEVRRDRLTRSDYLRAHLAEVASMRSRGVPLLGYLHWSLTDNYEWGSFTPRFGLFRIDFTDQLRRCEVDHLGDNPSATYREILQSWKSAAA